MGVALAEPFSFVISILSWADKQMFWEHLPPAITIPDSN